MRHVGLLGLGQSWGDAPFADPSIEWWGIANGHSLYPNWAIRRWFETHDEEVFTGRDATFLEWAATVDAPVYMKEHHPAIPQSVPIPKQAILHAIGRPYLTSTIAWMLGMCLIEKPDELSIYGISLSSAEEYRRQRPCAEYLVGKWEGMTGKLAHVADQALLLKDAILYGYGERTEHFDLVNKFAVGGADTIFINGVRVHNVWLDPNPAYVQVVERVEDIKVESL